MQLLIDLGMSNGLYVLFNETFNSVLRKSGVRLREGPDVKYNGEVGSKLKLADKSYRNVVPEILELGVDVLEMLRISR